MSERVHLDLYPALVDEWHPTKNGSKLPHEYTKNSHEEVWWCSKNCGHEWQAKIAYRSISGGCAICRGKRILAGFNDLASQHSELASQWHPTHNDGLLPTQVTPNSNKKVWWICAYSHEWEAKILNRTNKNSGCPVCVNRQILVGFNDLSSRYPSLAAEWHPKKNSNLLPHEIVIGTETKVWWRCHLGHEWQASVKSRCKGTGCPYCAGKMVSQGFNDLLSQRPLLSKEWHPTRNGDLFPSHVVTSSNKKVWWICHLGHEWETQIATRARGAGCVFCSGQKVLVGFNDLATANPKIAVQWHPTKNGQFRSSHFTQGSSHQKIWWLCERGHEWHALISDRLQGKGCPECAAHTFVSKSEQAIADFLIENHIVIKQSDRFILSGGELDIYIPSHKIAIEYNGVYWHTENQGKDKTYHYNKWLACKALGIQLIQIWEDEWNKNPEQIKAMLLHKLGITQQEKVFARKTLVAQLSKTEIESFLEEHHIQGYAAGSHYLVLREKSTNELVSVLVLKKEANNTLNIIRYATSKNVVGGFTKLLKYAELEYKPSRFITFSDHCVSNGGLYENNGFTPDKELAPDYRYVVGNQREHKFGYRLKRFKNDPNLKYEEGLTERELAALNSIPRIWDAGKTRWVKNILHHKETFI